jgi:hypothetical protein
MKPVAMVAVAAVAAFAAGTAFAEDAIADEAAEMETEGQGHKWFSFHAFADIETAYVSRGYIWDTHPYSAQYADTVVDFDMFGRAEAATWTYSAMSSSGTSAEMSRYAYAEIDYLLRYYYDIEIADGWRLQNGVGRQWVTNPGFRGGHTLIDWQALQVLHNPWLTPYWRLRAIRKPIKELFWVVGVKRSFSLMDGLTLTLDLSSDIGDNRHYVNLYGPKDGVPGARYHSVFKDFTFMARLDYALVEHVDLFAFVGQFCLLSSEARDAVKAMDGPEMRRDITFGGVGVALDF